MSGFDDVVRAAALGARNRPLAAASLSAPVAAVLSGADGAERVLEAVAAHAAARRAVVPVATATALDLPARPTPVIDSGPADVLTRIMALDHRQDELIVRVLRLVRRRGLRLPPMLLNRAAIALSGDDLDEVVALMDERDRAVFALDGRWADRIRRFAQRNAPPDPTQWEDGDAQDRAEQGSQSHTRPAREDTGEVSPPRKDETLHECLFLSPVPHPSRHAVIGPSGLETR